MSREKSMMNSRSSSRADQSIIDSNMNRSSSKADIRKSSMLSNNDRKQSYNGQMLDNLDDRKQSSMSSYDDDSNYYTQTSSYSSSYQKTNINGQETESSSFNEQHYDSRDDDGNNKSNRKSINHGNSSRRNSASNNGFSRRESRKSSSGPLPLWLSPAEESDCEKAVRRSSTVSSKKSISKVYIA